MSLRHDGEEVVYQSLVASLLLWHSILNIPAPFGTKGREGQRIDLSRVNQSAVVVLIVYYNSNFILPFPNYLILLIIVNVGNMENVFGNLEKSLGKFAGQKSSKNPLHIPHIHQPH